MRLAIIADTHLPRGQRRIPERFLEEIRAADLLLHAGDVCTDGVLAELRSLGPPLHAVSGNVDTPGVAAQLPVELNLDLEGVTISMLHDSGPAKGRLERLRAKFPDSDAVVFGHSHMPLLEERDGFQIFNPGSPTERRRAPTHTMGVAEIAARRIVLRHLEL